TNEVVGSAYERLNVVKRYLNLQEVNDSLSIENSKLKTELLSLKNIDSSKTLTVKDTVFQQQYTLVSAKVIKNSITQANNIITINRGSNDGLVSGMGVISPQQGIVGYVYDVSAHFATIRSLLHENTFVSVTLKKNNAFGSLVWGEGNHDYRKAYVKEIPNHFKVNIGDTVITSGYSKGQNNGFPKGIPVGRISRTQISTGDSFMTLEVNLFNDFSTLQYVYVIKDKFAQEQQTLENRLPDER
ncbi:MAG: rod shape-determining protein MreC, partial [Pedobacter sp.]|nr:rod shape-determining protein MreC [Pedobacter sp.]